MERKKLCKDNAKCERKKKKAFNDKCLEALGKTQTRRIREGSMTPAVA